eukprot:3386095-Rhodomonas_salina.2
MSRSASVSASDPCLDDGDEEVLLTSLIQRSTETLLRMWPIEVLVPAREQLRGLERVAVVPREREGEEACERECERHGEEREVGDHVLDGVLLVAEQLVDAARILSAHAALRLDGDRAVHEHAAEHVEVGHDLGVELEHVDARHDQHHRHHPLHHRPWDHRSHKRHCQPPEANHNPPILVAHVVPPVEPPVDEINLLVLERPFCAMCPDAMPQPRWECQAAESDVEGTEDDHRDVRWLPALDFRIQRVVLLPVGVGGTSESRKALVERRMVDGNRERDENLERVG